MFLLRQPAGFRRKFTKFLSQLEQDLESCTQQYCAGTSKLYAANAHRIHIVREFFDIGSLNGLLRSAGKSRTSAGIVDVGVVCKISTFDKCDLLTFVGTPDDDAQLAFVGKK